MVIFFELALLSFDHALEIPKFTYHLIIPKKLRDISNIEYICSFKKYQFKTYLKLIHPLCYPLSWWSVNSPPCGRPRLWYSSTTYDYDMTMTLLHPVTDTPPSRLWLRWTPCSDTPPLPLSTPRPWPCQPGPDTPPPRPWLKWHLVSDTPSLALSKPRPWPWPPLKCSD